MRFLLRLLLLLALASFLLRHYGSYMRENLWRVHTAENAALQTVLLGLARIIPRADRRKRTSHLECWTVTT